MIDDMDKLITYIESKGCEPCLYCEHQDECCGIACYGGEPIEPPCCYQTPDNYLDFDIILQEIKDSSDEIKQTKIVVDKINTEELVVPNTSLKIMQDIVNYFNEEREEKDMNKVLKLYEERKREEINNKYYEKIDNEYSEIGMIEKYKDLVKTFEDNLETLFNSQENFDNDYLVTVCDSNCYKYILSEKIKGEIGNKYEKDLDTELGNLEKLINEVDAQLSLSDDLTYQLEVLNRYGIIDKKTNKITV